MPQIDYDALAKQAGAVSSAPVQTPDYDALARQAGAISHDEAHPLDAAKRAIHDWWDQVSNGPLNLVQTGKGIAGMFTGESERAMGQQNLDLWQKAKNAYNHGDYTGAAAHALNYALNGIPGLQLGSALDEAGEKFQRGDVGGGIGHTLGVATNIAIGAKGPNIVDLAMRAPATVGAVFEAHPDIALVKALRPTPSDANFIERLPDARADVAAAGKVTNNETLLKTAAVARDMNRQAWEQWASPARDAGLQAAGAPIVQATVKSIPETLWREDPQQAQRIVDTARQAYGDPLDVRTLETLLKEKNAELNAFYARAEGKQNAAVQSGSPEAVVKAQRDAIADSLYKLLDPQNEGAGPKEIQERYGAIRALEDAATRRRNSIIAEQSVSPAGKAVKVAQAAGKLAKLDPEAAVDTLGGSDSLIRRAFANTGPARPLPTPGAAGTPLGYPGSMPPARQLAAGPVVTPVPEDSSFVRSVPAQPAPPNPARALPPASTIFAGPAPDDSFVRGVPAQPTPPNPTRALPPAATIFAGPAPDDSFVRGVPAQQPFRTGFPQGALPPGSGSAPDPALGSQHGDLVGPRRMTMTELMRMKPAEAQQLLQDKGVEFLRVGPHGPIAEHLQGTGPDAVEWLLQQRTGEVPGAIVHPEIGPIDVVWGKAGDPQKGFKGGYGLAHIEAKHPEIVDRLPEIIQEASVRSANGQHVILETADHKADVRLNWLGAPKKWLLTAYEKYPEKK
ncbi:MAG TPA: hypothetical protein VHB50_17340 [Bryobacteraceae bacterium]|nr:hypothetical protein [Bryobacteraceae bacterium]